MTLEVNSNITRLLINVIHIHHHPLSRKTSTAGYRLYFLTTP